MREGDAAAAADLLASPSAWAAALARPWTDGGAALATVVGLGAHAPGAARTARAALQALGEGLAPGTTRSVTADRHTMDTVRDAVGALVAAQIGAVVVGLSRLTVGGPLDPAADTALRGLGLLVSSPAQDDQVTGALATSLRAGARAGSAAEVAGAYVGVQQYGQRVIHALACAQALADAVDRQVNFTIMIEAPATLLLAGRSEEKVFGRDLLDPLATALHADGTVDLPMDHGRCTHPPTRRLSPWRPPATSWTAAR